MEKHWTEEVFEEVKAICENAIFEADLEGGYNHANITIPTSIGEMTAHTDNSDYYGWWSDWEIKMLDTGWIATVERHGLANFFAIIKKIENK